MRGRCSHPRAWGGRGRDHHQRHTCCQHPGGGGRGRGHRGHCRGWGDLQAGRGERLPVRQAGDRERRGQLQQVLAVQGGAGGLRCAAGKDQINIWIFLPTVKWCNINHWQTVDGWLSDEWRLEILWVWRLNLVGFCNQTDNCSTFNWFLPLFVLND